ncbi:MAG: hypothetical protein BWY85_00236 [Firmicutes bacterium ADurb.Bin506]|nr:MAG: hypothetical protein BWY85_00236 [Firmicutes bacterium ADurb.Bin506]
MQRGSAPKADRVSFGYSLNVHRQSLCCVRSPNSSNSNNVRHVNTDGSANSSNAYDGHYGVRPALVEYRDQVDRSSGRKQRPTHQRNEYPVQRRNAEDKHMTLTPRGPPHTQRAPGLSRR